LPEQRHHTSASNPPLLLRGLDSLYMSFYLDTANSYLDWEQLSYLRECAQMERRGGIAETVTGSETFAVMPHGKHPYRYILINKAFEVRLAEHNQPNCHVRFSSEALWLEGAENLLSRLRTWFASLAMLERRSEGVSRADWAFDFHLPEIDFTEDHFVSRARKDAKHRENGLVQTFRFGQGDIVVRVYDKCAEIEQQSGKTWFHQLWGRSDAVWRVEFQVRGERLKQGGIASFDALRGFEGDLLRELATQHTTLRRPNGDSNRSRWPRHPLWNAVIEAIGTMPQTGLVRQIDDLQPISYLLHHAGKSLYGNAKNAAMLLHFMSGGKVVPDLAFVLEELPGILKEHHNDALFRADVEQRIKKRVLGLG
jgi:hypothetical protein